MNGHFLHLHQPLQLTRLARRRDNDVTLAALVLNLIGFLLPADQKAHLQVTLALSIAGLSALLLLTFLYF